MSKLATVRRPFLRISGQTLFALYLVGLMAIGAALLLVPTAWNGPGALRPIDALFTAVSAVAVTGLITVDTALYSPFGQVVVLVLIQGGGLGIVAFTTIFLLNPSARLPFKDQRLITSYFVGSVETRPRAIVRAIVVSTVVAEMIGAALLTAGFAALGVPKPLFNGLFHAVSAFCNAGFSTFSSGLEGFVHHPTVTVPVLALVVLGGLGFVVIGDLWRRLTGSSRRLSLHSRLVLVVTGALITVGALLFLALEHNGVFAGFSVGERLHAALFQSITTRTAGFNTVDQAALSAPSALVTGLLMFIGAGPGSTAGGIKVTTFFLLVLLVIFRVESDGDVRIQHRTVTAKQMLRAAGFVGRAVAIAFVAVFALLSTETLFATTDASVRQLVFEVVSAMGTVGLSQSVTAGLTDAGKIVVILTMFAGRFGLIAWALPRYRRPVEGAYRTPTEEVLLG